ncbi:gamma-butyrobetaine dioxygenase-like [Gigantopelta aegis]|uniref:gamma-butyrobetaine dioxygenase-like n=1 Tax=Gigantopelta aegis TaxID=1735272 RepID=UPI001B8884F8|nr:gamma-butyrobetaine dioxygenase-like [Gigantopelta aegis]
MTLMQRNITKVGKIVKCFIQQDVIPVRSCAVPHNITSHRGLVVGSAKLKQGVCGLKNYSKSYKTVLTSNQSHLKCMSTASSNSSYGVDKVQISPDNRYLAVRWTNGKQSQYHSVWLRHNCHCDDCKQKDSGQKIFDVASIPTVVHLHQVTVKGNTLHLIWGGECEHRGEVPASLLWQCDYSQEALNRRYQDTRLDENCWTKKIPEMYFEEIINSDKGLLSFLTNINVYGLCLLKKVPLKEDKVTQVAKRIWPYIENTIYGEIFEVVAAPKPINVAYSDVHLDLHMDLVYYESPPGLQLLHAVRFDDCVVGGESTFLDVFQVAQQFKVTHPEEFRSLVQIPASFQKIHYDRELPVHLTRQQPHIVLNHNEEIVRVNWAPAFEAPLTVNEENVETYYKAYGAFARAVRDSPNLLTMRMKPGDMTVFNNRRMLHGREQFKLNGGVRFLKGAYVHTDHFKIRLQTLSRLLGDDHTMKHVGNGDWF